MNKNTKIKTEDQKLFDKYSPSFSETYLSFAKYDKIKDDIADIEYIIKNKKDMYITFSKKPSKSNHSYIKIYTTDKKMNISTIAPILLNHRLTLIEEFTFEFKINNNIIFLQIFKIETGRFIINKEQEKIICDNISDTYYNNIDNDFFSSLLTINSVTKKDVNLIRTFFKYARQLSLPITKKYIAETFYKHNYILLKLIEYFNIKFNPALNISINARNKKLKNIVRAFDKYLIKVSSASEDYILKLFFNIAESCVRTNFYLNSSNDWITLKIDCSSIIKMPEPKPWREIFIYGGMKFEGCHLRAGKIARGGIRWSDRYSDYRTEILGLMKTQIIKNSQIVPTGSKGGFIVKGDTGFENVKETYKNFITAILEIQDNIKNNKIIHPKNLIIHEESDPYLVVAADKGTAMFSDTANSISNNFNFWLGDAFASGGQYGYDHKKLGITSRGAFESFKRNLLEIGKNPDKDDITVIGIGDMSGDVFGNGMLLSKKIKLLAAFDHRNIFIDPEPKSDVSYNERKRLFKLKGSSWSNYNRKFLSAGGKIFSRKDKIISITSQIRKLLNTDKNNLTPEEIIKLILKTKCDALYNGGIGTYIKSSAESNSDAGDSQNDVLRVNADELKCKIIVEGGNLGLTQKARIEFARLGGKIYTDSIDNSAGVNLSDYEVNLKILLDSQKKIKTNKRNTLLKKYQKETVNTVLRNNYLQTLSISIDKIRSQKCIRTFEGALKYWENKNFIDRRLEALPSEDEFKNRVISKTGLYKPELAVFLSFSKMDIKNRLLDSPIIHSKYLYKYILNYFSPDLASIYKKEILNHRLKDQLLVTVLSNHIVNLHGSTIIYKLTSELGLSASRVSEALIAAYEILEADKILNDILNPALNINIHDRYQLFHYIENNIVIAAVWLLKNIKYLRSRLNEVINSYKGVLNKFYNKYEFILNNEEKLIFNNDILNYQNVGLDKTSALNLSLMKFVPTVFDILRIKLKLRKNFESAGKHLYKIGSLLEVHLLIELLHNIKTTDDWEDGAIENIISDIRKSRRRITERIILDKISPEKYFEKRFRSYETLKRSINIIKAAKPTKFSPYIIVSHQIENLAST